jgi:hypothetical protein
VERAWQFSSSSELRFQEFEAKRSGLERRFATDFHKKNYLIPDTVSQRF